MSDQESTGEDSKPPRKRFRRKTQQAVQTRDTDSQIENRPAHACVKERPGGETPSDNPDVAPALSQAAQHLPRTAHPSGPSPTADIDRMQDIILSDSFLTQSDREYLRKIVSRPSRFRRLVTKMLTDFFSWQTSTTMRTVCTARCKVAVPSRHPMISITTVRFVVESFSIG